MWKFSNWIVFGYVFLPLPVGITTIILYLNRKELNIPEWFSNIVAPVIISSHRIWQDEPNVEDFIMVISYLVISIFLVVLCLFIIRRLIFFLVAF